MNVTDTVMITSTGILLGKVGVNSHCRTASGLTGCQMAGRGLGMPAAIGTEGRLAPSTEPGVPLVVEGVVTTATGAVASGVIIYAY